MPAPQFALPVQYIRQIVEQVKRSNVPLPASFLRIRWDALPADEFQILDMDAFVQAIQDAIDATGDSAFGLLVGERMRINSHGMLGFAAMNCATLAEAIGVIEQYFLTRTRLVKVRQQTVGPDVHFKFEDALPLGRVRQPVQEAIVLTIKNLYDHITAGSAPIPYVSWNFAPPPHAELVREKFGCEMRYGQSWCGFAFPVSALHQPLSMADPTTLRQAIQACQREMHGMSAEPAWAAKLARVLLERQDAFPSLEAAAQLFNLTPRTLHRRLLEEGTSYRDVLDEVRHKLALEHLQAGKLTIQEIAYQLGYTDTANFRRAFIRWQAISPAAYQAGVNGTLNAP
ncbi:AraC family transcriptional regulator [Duganella sp. LX20W]|uniref:AraC family transcriptional regulator n=1 Tax=Rugamonas brunnea TaxID=2758569 RepID=A0A7W2EUA9_9BURK|nr:AraC family transcriptional regulator [Rugamonas brunnea]MBA5638734.1 AraC family transcriptional regulator [Rugamonas brunnea]